jgi:hypothetical protein
MQSPYQNNIYINCFKLRRQFLLPSAGETILGRQCFEALGEIVVSWWCPLCSALMQTNEAVTGIVAAAAISAALALRAVGVVLETTARKQSSERLGELIHEVEGESERLVQLARDDGVVYAAYLQARRQRSPEVQATLRRTSPATLRASGRTVPRPRGSGAA